MPSKKQRRAAAPVRGTISPDPSAGDPPSKSRRRTVAVSAGLICAVLAVYGQTAWFEFVSHDDPQHVYENEHVATGLSLENLAWACPGCNLRKSDRVEIPAADGPQMVPLFSPRIHLWGEHFTWDGHEARGLTAIGRATVVALDLNHPRRLRIRQAEEAFGLFPPEERW